jgi:hypothetical protein
MTKQEQKKVSDLRQKLLRMAHGAAVAPCTPEERAARKRRAMEDYAFFVRTYFGKIAYCGSAPWHVELANTLAAKKRVRMCLVAPRGHAKSTNLIVLDTLWQMCKGTLSYLMLVGETLEKAEKHMLTIQYELEHNALFREDFGIRKGNVWTPQFFMTENEWIFQCFGPNQDPRGSRVLEKRPGRIIVSDYDTRRSSASPAQLAKKIAHLEESVFPCAPPNGECQIIIENNAPYEEMVVRHFMQQPGWDSMVVPILDDAGHSTWPEMLSDVAVAELRETVGEHVFFSEYMHQPSPSRPVFQRKWVRYKRALGWEQYQRFVLYIDPGTSDSKHSDYKAATLWGLCPKVGDEPMPEFHFIRAVTRRTGIQEFTEALFRLWAEVPEGVQRRVAIYMEGGGVNRAQDRLAQDVYMEAQRRGIYFPVQKDPRPTNQKGPKRDRILRSSRHWERRQVYIDSSQQDNPDMKENLRQTLNFDPKNPRGIDDGPDCNEGALYWLDQWSPYGAGRRDANATPRVRTSKRKTRAL